MLLFSSDLENQKKSTKKLLEVINEFYGVMGCKMQPQKSIVLLYTSNMLKIK